MEIIFKKLYSCFSHCWVRKSEIIVSGWNFLMWWLSFVVILMTNTTYMQRFTGIKSIHII